MQQNGNGHKLSAIQISALQNNQTQEFGTYHLGEAHFQNKKDKSFPPNYPHNRGREFRMYEGHTLQTILGADWQHLIEADGLTRQQFAYIEDSGKAALGQRYFLDKGKLDCLEAERKVENSVLRAEIERLLMLGKISISPRKSEFVMEESDFCTAREAADFKPLRHRLTSNDIHHIDLLVTEAGGQWEAHSEDGIYTDRADKGCVIFKLVFPLDKLKAYGESLGEGKALRNLSRAARADAVTAR